MSDAHDSSAASDRPPQPYTAKFMVNIFNEPKHRTRYLKLLENFTTSPFVTYEKMIVSVLIFTFLAIVVTGLLIAPGAKLKYTAVWVVAFAIAALALLLIFALPARESSLFTHAVTLLNEKSLGRAMGSRSRLRTIGVKCVEDSADASGATINFNDGAVGYMYHVNGSLSISTLPAVVENIRVARYNYLLSRDDAVQETLITRVRNAAFTTQLKSLEKSYNACGDSQEDKWRKYMLNSIHNYIYTTMRENDILIEQFLILRAPLMQTLNVAAQKLNDAAACGLYARVKRLDKTEIDYVLRLMSSSEMPSSSGDELMCADIISTMKGQ